MVSHRGLTLTMLLGVAACTFHTISPDAEDDVSLIQRGVNMRALDSGQQKQATSRITTTADDLRQLAFNPIFGQNHIGHFKLWHNMTFLKEQASQTQALGSNIIKFKDTDDDPTNSVLDMNFKYHFIWFRSHGDGVFKAGTVSPAKANLIWQKTYDYASNLLLTYNNTGKHFFLGNWEGDWYMLPGKDTSGDAPDGRITAMIEWATLRQAAVDKAKQDVSHSNVHLHYYLELNRVLDAYRPDLGFKRLVNSVLPHVSGLDMVSYSSYDCQKLNEQLAGDVLDFIEGNMKNPKPLCGECGDCLGCLPYSRRVMIGEYVINAKKYRESPSGVSQYVYNEEKYMAANLDVARKFVKLNVPFVLHWAFYNNEMDTEAEVKVPRGQWLVDNWGKRTALWTAFNVFYKDSATWWNEHPGKSQADFVAEHVLPWLDAKLNAYPDQFYKRLDQNKADLRWR